MIGAFLHLLIPFKLVLPHCILLVKVEIKGDMTETGWWEEAVKSCNPHSESTDYNLSVRPGTFFLTTP